MATYFHKVRAVAYSPARRPQSEPGHCSEHAQRNRLCRSYSPNWRAILFRMRDWNVLRFSPRRAAAPTGSPTWPRTWQLPRYPCTWSAPRHRGTSQEPQSRICPVRAVLRRISAVAAARAEPGPPRATKAYSIARKNLVAAVLYNAAEPGLKQLREAGKRHDGNFRWMPLDLVNGVGQCHR